jgi:hypothetical protein
MPPVDPNSISYLIGQVIGAILVVGLPILFGYFVYKYVSHKEKRHLVMMILTGIPTLLFLGLFVFGIVTALTKAAGAREQHKPMSSSTVQDLKDGPWQEAMGEKFKYTYKLPDKQRWTIKTAGDYDQLASYRELYIGIIPELLDIELDNFLKLIQKSAKKKFADLEFLNARDLTIDGKPWKTYEMKLTLDGMKLHYRHFLCADHGKVVQVMCWCTESQFDSCSPVIDLIAESFRFNAF